MNGCSVPAAGPRERTLRRMCRLSLFCIFAGLAVMIGGFIVRSASVFDEMSASANLVIPGEFAVMSDGEFVRSLLPAAGVAGIVHLVGVVAGLMGRTRAEDRRELARCALGVGANAFFFACACITPVVGLVPDPRALVPLLVVCGAAVLAVCVPIPRHACQRGRDIGGRGSRGHAGYGRSVACRPVRDAPRTSYDAGATLLARVDCRGRLHLHVRPGGHYPVDGPDRGYTGASARRQRGRAGACRARNSPERAPVLVRAFPPPAGSCLVRVERFFDGRGRGCPGPACPPRVTCLV